MKQMSNSDTFYYNAKNFQDERIAILEKYNKRMTEIESTRGSEFFEKESRKAVEARDSGLKKAKDRYGRGMRLALSEMKKANSKRKVKAPTADELAILQMLKMRENISEDDLFSCAESLKGNSACLEILQEIAHSHGIVGHNFTALAEDKELSRNAVDRMIANCSNRLQDFLDYDTKKSGRMVQERNFNLYGTPKDSSVLRKRDRFDSKAGCFYHMFGTDARTEFDKFVSVIDGGLKDGE